LGFAVAAPAPANARAHVYLNLYAGLYSPEGRGLRKKKVVF
jgi:hypothetical protein